MPTSIANQEPVLNKVVIPRTQHSVSRNDIDSSALKVLYRLNKAGYQAFLVGGGVRDLLLGLKPKDFDIATNATPDEVKALFRNCRLVGRRFRLAHILFGREVIEVATFRGHHASGDKQTAHASESGMLLRDNVYGTLDEDAERRDFTVNALYYDISNFSVIDFAGGIEDLQNRTLRLIGDPVTRYKEDPVRMLRAIRFAAKLNMTLAPEVAEPIPELAPLLRDIPAARMFEESLKLLQAGHGITTFNMMLEQQVFLPLFPILTPYVNSDNPDKSLILKALANTDRRIAQGKRITPAFLFAALLWGPLQQRIKELNEQEQLPPYDALNLAANEVISQQIKSIAIPKRFTATVREIWQLQLRLPKRSGRRAYVCFEHPRFRAAYDFLLLRAEVEKETSQQDELAQLAQWWTDFQTQDEAGRLAMSKKMSGTPGKSRRRKPRKKPSATNK